MFTSKLSFEELLMSIKIKLLGHASFKLTIGDKIVYIDPYGGDNSLYEEKANVILSTHEHRDHSDPEKIALIRDDNTKILTSTKNSGNIEGNVIAIEPGEKQEVENIIVHGVHGYNVKRFRDSGDPFHPKGIQTAFVIEVENKRIYFAGDTDFIEEMKDLKNIDIAMLPMDGKYTMDPTEAMQAVEAIKPKMVIPMHWRDKSPDKFKTDVEAKHPDIKVTVIKPGEEFEF
ncbi:MAG: MBL fold metallo-hydrolase [Asgard group archaeon]|nr:MBL fold metallo-hydrolase [Asgard group archaeon]